MVVLFNFQVSDIDIYWNHTKFFENYASIVTSALALFERRAATKLLRA